MRFSFIFSSSLIGFVFSLQVLANSEKSCAEKYERMHADGLLNISIVHGYMDTNGDLIDLMNDEYWRNRTIETLVGKCPSQLGLAGANSYFAYVEDVKTAKEDRDRLGCGQKREYQRACGFKRTDDPEIFTKLMMTPGGQFSVVKVRILSAALTDRNQSNRESHKNFILAKFCSRATLLEKEKCLEENMKTSLSGDTLDRLCQKTDRLEFQTCKSRYAQNVWRKSIEDGDEIVMYQGHARDGGGPSFELPKLRPNKKVDYAWYQKNRPGHKMEEDAFILAQQKNKAPVIYSSLSCHSHFHFYENGKFPEVSPSTGFVLSRRISFYDEGVAALLTTIEGVLSGQCGKEISKNLIEASCGYQIYNF